MDHGHKSSSLPFQVIIPCTWIFALILNLPWFLFLDVQDNHCTNVPIYGQDWIPKAYHVLCLSLVAVSVAMMAGLYSRIVYNLWLKGEDNQSTFQQQVSTSNYTEVLNVKETSFQLHLKVCLPPGVLDGDFEESR